MRHRKGLTAHAMRMPDQIHAIAVGHRYQAVAGLRPSGGVGLQASSEVNRCMRGLLLATLVSISKHV